MIRVHLLTPCLAVGVGLAFLLPMRSGGSAPPWNPDEQNTALFDQEGGSGSRTLAAAAVSPTLAKWKDAARPKARIRSLVLGKEPKGVRLASFETQLSVLEGCASPDNVTKVVSVNMGGQHYDLCSTILSGASTACSVLDSNAQGWCSVDGIGNSPGYCSAGADGSPGNPAPGFCSVGGTAAGGGGNGSGCSTTGGAGYNCSTSPAPPGPGGVGGGGGTTCSVGPSPTGLGNGTGQTCSTGQNAGGAGKSGTCSVISSGNTASTCSVLENGGGGQGAPNVCSVDGAGAGVCSVTKASNLNGDFCSVAAGLAHAQCTVIPAGQNAFCSVQGTFGTCSVQGQSPPYDGNGLCGTP